MQSAEFKNEIKEDISLATSVDESTISLYTNTPEVHNYDESNKRASEDRENNSATVYIVLGLAIMVIGSMGFLYYYFRHNKNDLDAAPSPLQGAAVGVELTNTSCDDVRSDGQVNNGVTVNPILAPDHDDIKDVTGSVELTNASCDVDVDVGGHMETNTPGGALIGNIAVPGQIVDSTSRRPAIGNVTDSIQIIDDDTETSQWDMSEIPDLD